MDTRGYRVTVATLFVLAAHTGLLSFGTNIVTQSGHWVGAVACALLGLLALRRPRLAVCCTILVFFGLCVADAVNSGWTGSLLLFYGVPSVLLLVFAALASLDKICFLFDKPVTWRAKVKHFFIGVSAFFVLVYMLVVPLEIFVGGSENVLLLVLVAVLVAGAGALLWKRLFWVCIGYASILIAVFSLPLFRMTHACLSCGCQAVHVVPVARQTPSSCGNIKLYGSDNVPYEYEEVGVIGYYSKAETQDEGLRKFVAEAQKMGADVILNFRVSPVNSSGGFVMVSCAPNTVVYTGVAVKVKRP